MSTMTLRLEAYAKDAQRAIAAAQTLADERKHAEVEPVHLLHELADGHEAVQAALQAAGVDPADVVVEAELWLRRMAKVQGAAAYLSPRMLELLGRAEGEAARAGGIPVSVEHLMLACAQETEGGARKVLRDCGVSAPVLRSTLAGTKVEPASSGASAGAATPEAGTTARVAAKGTEASGAASPAAHAGTAVEEFGRDLTRLAAQGKFDPTVGRAAELRRMIQVLARRRENNPLLVGEPGIGKTAIVQALAGRIARGDVPAMLQHKRIVALDMGAMVAGAKLRGQLEERMRSVLASVRDSGGEILLFLPDLGALTGASAGAGDLLAAALGRGELRAIAVATPDAVRKAFDGDSLLARRFVPIAVEPPTVDEAIAVLRGVVGRFEVDHGVTITDPALVAAVQLARRYVQGAQLPKSAIDLIDEAAARVRVEMESAPASLDQLERELEAVEIQARSMENDLDPESRRARQALVTRAGALRPQIEAMRASWQKQLAEAASIQRLREELAAAERELEQVRAAEDTARAGELRFGTIPLLEKQLADLGAGDRAAADALVHDRVTAEDIADVVSAWSGVPVSKMMEAETEKLLRMEDTLRTRVIGQDPAVVALSKAVRRGRVGLRDPKRPIGSFLFLGPTGVGKTELAKALAEFLFDDEASLTRLDMSEFMEKHMVARLLGSPPGYVDSDQGGFLTEAVRQRPYSVILFDEMEKAHPDVFNILLQVLDDGRLTDSKGRPAHFQDTVIIMTSNVGSHLILDHEGTNESLRDKVEQELHRHFRPEFLNRIDDVVIFDPLDKDDLAGIADIQLRGLAKLLAPRHIGLEITDAAKARLVELGYEPAFGARPLKRVILKELQDPMAEAMLRGGYADGDTIRVDVKDGGFTFEKVRSADAAS